jgi:prepilin-type N-terminal cleavage/methylation domain-containing protein
VSRALARAGATLLELVVALAILSLAATLAIPALRAAGEKRTPTEREAVAAARRDAVEHGRAVTVQLRDSPGVRLLTAFPDGRVAADTSMGVDPLTGRPRAAR